MVAPNVVLGDRCESPGGGESPSETLHQEGTGLCVVNGVPWGWVKGTVVQNLGGLPEWPIGGVPTVREEKIFLTGCRKTANLGVIKPTWGH